MALPWSRRITTNMGRGLARRVLVVVVSLLAAHAALAETATVIRVVDGDTLLVEFSGTEERVRLIGVDTPETVHPNKPVEHFGKEASAFTKEAPLENP